MWVPAHWFTVSILRWAKPIVWRSSSTPVQKHVLLFLKIDPHSPPTVLCAPVFMICWFISWWEKNMIHNHALIWYHSLGVKVKGTVMDSIPVPLTPNTPMFSQINETGFYYATIWKNVLKKDTKGGLQRFSIALHWNTLIHFFLC